MINELKEKVINGESITKEQAMSLAFAPLEQLRKASDEIRRHFCGNNFDICTIVNAKSGKCSENCKYCAQSSFYKTKCEEYPLLSSDELCSDGKRVKELGINRYSVVTSGKRLSRENVIKMCENLKELKKNVGFSLCGSFGLLDYEDFTVLKASGMERCHNNLETSRRNFPNICTTHSYDDKIKTIKAAQRAGISVCSGGIIGLGETMEDRIDMALQLRELSIESVPINVLNPIKGTPYENNEKISYDEICRTLAIYRFILPKAFIRMAGGRGLLPDKGKQAFLSGANAAISGDMLTTSGIHIKDDLAMLKELGFKVID